MNAGGDWRVTGSPTGWANVGRNKTLICRKKLAYIRELYKKQSSEKNSLRAIVSVLILVFEQGRLTIGFLFPCPPNEALRFVRIGAKTNLP